MRRVDHQLECGVDERARLLRVEVAHQFVEPLMSANSAVTVLRSPSIASDAAPSAATMTCDLGEATVVETAAFVRPIAVPHFLQNRAPGLTDALHAGQISSSFVPHPSQNEASPGLSRLQDGQRIGSPVPRLLPHPARTAEGGWLGRLLRQSFVPIRAGPGGV